jgi:hypothetical protein
VAVKYFLNFFYSFQIVERMSYVHARRNLIQTGPLRLGVLRASKVFPKIGENSAGRPLKEYHITLEMAKDSRGQRGHSARFRREVLSERPAPGSRG